MFKVSGFTIWMVLVFDVFQEVTPDQHRIIILKDDSTESFLFHGEQSTVQTNNVTIVIRHVHQETITSDLRYLCENFLVGQTSVLDLTGSCLFYDNAAQLFVPYIKPSVCQCVAMVTQNDSSHIHLYATAAFSFVSRQRTTTAKIIIFLDPRTVCKEHILKAYTISAPLTVFDLSDASLNLNKWMKNMSLVSTPIYFVVIGSTGQIDLVLESAINVPLSDLYHWTIVVTGNMSSHWENKHWKKLIVFQHSLTSPSTMLSQYLQNFKKPANVSGEDVLPSGNTCKPGNISVLSQSEIDNISDMISPDIKLDILYLVKTDNGNISVTQVGEWSPSFGLNITESFSEHDNSNRLRVVTKHEPPFVIRNKTNGSESFTGFAIDTFDIIAKRLGIEYTLYEVEDQLYGTKRPDGTWSGIIGELVSGSADVAVAALPMTTERENVIDMTTPFYEFGGIQIITKANLVVPSLMAFTTVFSWPVWTCYFVLMVTCGVLIFIFERLSPYAPARHESNWSKYSVSEGLWFVATSFTQAGPENTPETFPARILIAGFWFFCSIMMATYTANLAAYLTTTRMTIPIESLDDLASQNVVKYSVVAGTSIHLYFKRMAMIEVNFYELWKNMTSDARKKDLTSTLADLAVWDYPLGEKYVAIWQAITETGLLNSTAEGIERVLGGDFAFIHEYPLLQYELLQHCGLTSVGKQFSSKPYAFALPHLSPLTKKISRVILELQGETILENLKSKWWNTSSIQCPTIDESKGLTFLTVGGIFILVACGVALGLLIFLLELTWSKIRRRKMREHFTMDGPPNSQTNLALDFEVDNISESGEGTSYQQTPV